MARPRAWGTRTLNQTLVHGTNTVFDLLLNLTEADTITAVRVIGGLDFFPSNVAAGNAGVIGVDIGVGVVAASAFATSGAVPDPSVDTEKPQMGWLYLVRYHVIQQATLFLTTARGSWDIRAARKVDRGKLFLAVKSDIVQGAGYTVQVSGKVRTLCLT